MFEEFKKITIKGGYFEQPTEFSLFTPNQTLSIIYGRNGSGKTSIAKAIRQLVGKDSKQPEEDGNLPFTITSDAVIPEDKETSVFIFDEEFVQENVRTKGKGLETIVMIWKPLGLYLKISIKQRENTV